MQLQQHINGAVDACGFFLDEAQQFHTVHALNHTDVRHDGAHFVLLQVSDEVPADVLRQLRSLGYKFLGAVLSEKALARLVGLGEFLDGVEL